MEGSSETPTKLLIQDVKSDDKRSDRSIDWRDRKTEQQLIQSGLSGGKDPKSDQSSGGPGYLGSTKRGGIQPKERDVKPQSKDLSLGGRRSVKSKELDTGVKDAKVSKGSAKKLGSVKKKTEEFVDTRRDLNDNAVPKMVTRNRDCTSLEISDVTGESVVVDLRRSGSTIKRVPKAGETVEGSAVPENNEKRWSQISVGADRRAVFIQDSTTDSHSKGCGTIKPDQLDRRIQQTKKMFVETENYTKAEKLLRRRGYLTLSGAPGEGKTSLALMLGVKYQQHGYDLVFVNDVDKFKLTNQFQLGRKLFVIFDDIFGTVWLTTDVPQLRSTLRDLRQCLESRVPNQGKTTLSLLVVFTTNSCNLQSGTSKLGWENVFFFKSSSVIKLNEQKTYSYSLDERKDMFQMHKLINNCTQVDFKEIADRRQMGIGFPLTCQLFSKHKPFQNNPKEFFQKPLFYLTKELEKCLELKNENAAAFVLMLLCDGKIDLMQVAKGFKNTPLEILFTSIQSLMPRVTEVGTTKAMRNFQGTFFTEGDITAFSHHIIYDVFACVLYKMIPKFVIENCSLKFLYERLRYRSGESVYDHFIYVADVHHEIVAKRLAQAVKEGIYSKVFTHPVLESTRIVDRLFCLLDLRKPHSLSKENEKVLLYWTMHSHSQYLVEKMFTSGFNFSHAEIMGAFEECAFSGNLYAMDFLILKYKSIKQYSLNQALTIATENNHSDMVQYLLKHCQDDISLQTERNVLVIAHRNGNMGMEKDIISAVCRQRGISLSYSDTGHLLHAACVTGDITLVNFVVPATDINKQIDGFTPVMTAAVLGRRDLFDLLVSRGADLRLTDKNSDTMLHLASVGGNTDIVKHLLPLFDINIRGQDGMTSVMKASVSGQNYVYDLLVSKKADLKLLDNYGNNVLHSASSGNSTYIVGKVLPLFDINVKGHVGWTAIMRAAYNGQEDVFDLLLSKGADLKLTDNLGANVLHWASCSDSVHIVNQLLPKFDINIRGYRGLTPVMHSASHGQAGVFKLLVSKGANIRLKDRHENNVLHLACCSNSTDIVKQVLSMFDVNARGQNGLTPVMNAACHGQEDVFDLLIAEGADLRMMNDYGSNLLYCASLGGNRVIVEHVLPLFDINSRGRKSLTPVMIAAREGHEEVFALLVKKGADLMLTDADDNNLLHLAHQGGCESIVEFLSTSHL